MTLPGNKPAPEKELAANEDRRKFLAACGKFAVVTPPALTLLLSTSLNSTAIAHSSGRDGDDGYGRGYGSRGEDWDHGRDHRDWRDHRRHGWWGEWW